MIPQFRAIIYLVKLTKAAGARALLNRRVLDD